MRQAVDNSNRTVSDTRPPVHTIASMPDPEGIYSAALGVADVSKSTIDVPNIRDGNGTLIKPDEWNLRPSNKNVGNYRPKDGEENGSRIYQMMLNSMQVLPVADISQMALLDNRIADTGVKGKRKAVDEIGSRTHGKKKAKDDMRTGNVTTRRSARAGASTKDDVTMENV